MPQKPRKPRFNKATIPPTSWDPVATWYKRWVGENGSEVHRDLAIPSVLDLLDLRAEETLLDIGCGTGVLAAYVPPTVRYIGVDASPRLLAKARSSSGTLRTFLQGDAAKLQEVEGLRQAMADAVVFLLSIQDMEPLDQILSAAGWAVKEGGRIVVLMMHPCFRVPRQSGWGWDADRKLQYRRVDSYLSSMTVPVRPIAPGRSGSIVSIHMPLQEYVNGLAERGFVIDRLTEVPAFPGIMRRGPRGDAENKANREIPLFLGLRAVKGRM